MHLEEEEEDADADATHRWSALEKLAGRKPPIGFAPFARVCIHFGASNEAKKYIERVDDVQSRYELYVRVQVR